MATTTTPQAGRDQPRARRSLLLGTILWFVHLNVVYGFASLACKWSWFSFSIVGISGVQLVEIIITFVTLPLLLFLIYHSWREWRRFQTEQPPANPHMLEDTEKDSRPLVAFIVMLVNSFFFLFVLSMVVPIFALRPCGPS